MSVLLTWENFLGLSPKSDNKGIKLVGDQSEQAIQILVNIFSSQTLSICQGELKALCIQITTHECSLQNY